MLTIQFTENQYENLIAHLTTAKWYYTGDQYKVCRAETEELLKIIRDAGGLSAEEYKIK